MQDLIFTILDSRTSTSLHLPRTFPVLFEPRTHLLYPNSASSLLTITQLVAQIYTHSFISTHVFFTASPSSNDPISQLTHALKSPIHHANFQPYPGILLWVLLVGATTAEKRPERDFTHFLARTGLGMSVCGWFEEAREAMMRFRGVRRKLVEW